MEEEKLSPGRRVGGPRTVDTAESKSDQLRSVFHTPPTTDLGVLRAQARAHGPTRLHIRIKSDRLRGNSSPT